MPIPENQIIAVDDVELEIESGLHPWYLSNQAAVDRAWEEDHLRRPFLFNGTIYMHRGFRFDGRRLTGMSHVAPYAMLQYWLRQEDRGDDVWHLFAVPVMVSSDGALILARMSSRTANPGRIYSPSGSLDESDGHEGYCDLSGNMTREVFEETGLDLATAEAEAGAQLFHRDHIVTVFRRFRFTRSAEDLAEAVRRHISRQDDPELVEPVIVRDASEVSAAMPPYMQAIIAFHYDAG